MKAMHKILLATGAGIGLALSVPALAEGPGWDDILNDAKTTDQVVSYGMGPWQ